MLGNLSENLSIKEHESEPGLTISLEGVKSLPNKYNTEPTEGSVRTLSYMIGAYDSNPKQSSNGMWTINGLGNNKSGRLDLWIYENRINFILTCEKSMPSILNGDNAGLNLELAMDKLEKIKEDFYEISNLSSLLTNYHQLG